MFAQKHRNSILFLAGIAIIWLFQQFGRVSCSADNSTGNSNVEKTSEMSHSNTTQINGNKNGTRDSNNSDVLNSSGNISNNSTDLASTEMPMNLTNRTDPIELCNQKFPIQIAAFVELNVTGTLPDEEDEVAQCFIRCYLEMMKIIINDTLNRERAKELNWAPNEDVLDDCFKEARGKSN